MSDMNRYLTEAEAAQMAQANLGLSAMNHDAGIQGTPYQFLGPTMSNDEWRAEQMKVAAEAREREVHENATRIRAGALEAALRWGGTERSAKDVVDAARVFYAFLSGDEAGA